MEVDRVEGCGGWNQKGKGQKGKGKSDKGFSKGKNKGGGKSQGKSKDGKSKSWDKNGKSKGKQPEENKGEGKGSGDKYCYNCGGAGHYARDCWSAVRSAQAGPSSSPSSTVNTGDWSNLTSVSQQGGQSQQQSQMPQQPQSSPKSTQFKVARIGEVSHEVSDSQHALLLFDLTSSPMPTSSHLRAIHYFIGDDETFDGDVTVGSVRTLLKRSLMTVQCTTSCWTQELMHLCFQFVLQKQVNLRMQHQSNCMMLRESRFQLHAHALLRFL